MYPKSNFQSVISSTGSPVSGSSDRPLYRPFSYYVLGGIDVDGDSLIMNGDVGFDDDSEILAGCAVDGSSDPRVSGFDIAEQCGIESYKEVQAKAAKSAPGSSNDDDKS